MKKIFISLLLLASCQKTESKKSVFLNSTLYFTASYVNELHSSGQDSVFVELSNGELRTFATHSDPCLNISFMFNTWSTDTLVLVPFSIRSEREQLETGVLKFKQENDVTFI
jgi:hypothetical protein